MKNFFFKKQKIEMNRNYLIELIQIIGKLPTITSTVSLLSVIFLYIDVWTTI